MCLMTTMIEGFESSFQEGSVVPLHIYQPAYGQALCATPDESGFYSATFLEAGLHFWRSSRQQQQR